MDTDLIVQNVTRHIEVSPSERDLFLSKLTQKILKRRELHLVQGELCRYSTFVTDGCLKGFAVDKKGVEHILSFAPREWWIADMYSFINQKPGNLNIEAVVDTQVLLLSWDDQQTLFNEVPKFERFFRMLVEKSLVAHQQRLIHNLSLTAEERYLEFLKKYPTMLECVPLHNIASYIGITPEFLSKIRARIARAGKA